jgi:hypothetical protein
VLVLVERGSIARLHQQRREGRPAQPIVASV